MSKLIIAEKPSVGMSIASAVGAKSSHDGYIDGNGYIVTWCVGHLAAMANAEVYDEKYENGDTTTCRLCRTSGSMCRKKTKQSSLK